MKPGKYSYMAEAVARFRAAHQVIDDEPKILRDPLSLILLGEAAASEIEAERQMHSSWYLRRARTLAVVRSRYTEDQLATAIAGGVRQYVILGAGLDTSPYRPGHPGQQARIWEVDHPDTQRWKRERLQAANIDPPANLEYLSVDFSRETPLERLQAQGFDASQPAFFSWLGVNYYLELPAVTDIFDQIGRCARGTRVVLDFVVSDAQLSDAEQVAVGRIMEFAAQRDEPWLTRFAPDDLVSLLRTCGFASTEYLSSDAATARYLAGRVDGLALDQSIQLMTGVV